MGKSSAKVVFDPLSEILCDDSGTEVGFAEGEEMDIWHELIRDCIAAGASIHTVDQDNRTPLDALVDSFWFPCFHSYLKMDRMYKQLEETLYGWLKDIVAAGVDLEGYGVSESSNRKKGTEFSGCHCRRYYGMPSEYHTRNCTFGFRLIGFSYGPHVTDWQFWLSDPRDIFAGEFWDMIETSQPENLNLEPQLDIPGSWTKVDG
jgi:hypothetical protein